MAKEVSTPRQVEQRLSGRHVHCSAAYEADGYSAPGLRAGRDSSLLKPCKPPVSQQVHMVGLDFFSGLAHESEEVGRRFQDGHSADLAIARGRGRQVGVGRGVQNLKRTNEALVVELETDAAPRSCRSTGWNRETLRHSPPTFDTVVIGAVDDAFDD